MNQMRVYPRDCETDFVESRMTKNEMDRLADAHIEAEMRGETHGCVEVLAVDVVHDAVGKPYGPLHGRMAAGDFHNLLAHDLHTEKMEPVYRCYGHDFCLVEHEWTGSVRGAFRGLPGHGRRISFRMFHLWAFRDGRICRENVWLDSGAIVRQLTAESAGTAA
jgi:steroid delta-isomerase-like uncharacterized protein